MSALLQRFALFYPMRLVGTTFMVVVTTLYAWQFDRFDAMYFALVAVLLVYPHVVQSFARKDPQRRQKIEMRTFLFDSFMLGLVVHSTAFTPLPTFVLVTVGLVNALAVNGIRQMLYSAAALAVGILAYAMFAGFNVQPRDVFAIDVTCAVFLFVYFMTFAYSSYNRNALLQQSETALREQKASLEIEKLRSDGLLFNLLPAKLASEMRRSGKIAPAAFDVTLVAVELRGFARKLEDGDATEVLAHLMHCFKAFDAIGDRRGLEKLKTMGDIYIGVAGLPTASANDAASAVATALDIREFLADLAVSREARGALRLDAAISVHGGSVIGGVVETSKISYDVWGSTVRTLLALLRACPDGDVAVSEATRTRAGDAFDWTRAGELQATATTRTPFYSVRKRGRMRLAEHA
jgi:class 3 adenylate cyclase